MSIPTFFSPERKVLSLTWLTHAEYDNRRTKAFGPYFKISLLSSASFYINVSARPVHTGGMACRMKSIAGFRCSSLERIVGPVPTLSSDSPLL